MTEEVSCESIGVERVTKSSHAPSVNGWLDIPPGAAIVERIGWEDDDEGAGERFTATLVFHNGAPDFTTALVFDPIPVFLVDASPSTDRRPVSQVNTSNTDASPANPASVTTPSLEISADLDLWRMQMRASGDGVPDFWDELDTSDRLGEWLAARGYRKSDASSLLNRLNEGK